VDIEDGSFGFRRDAELAVFGVGKVIGVGLRAPAPAIVAQPSRWAWFLVAPGNEADPEALRKLYDDPRVVSRAH
jgi:hypothetical protein